MIPTDRRSRRGNAQKSLPPLPHYPARPTRGRRIPKHLREILKPFLERYKLDPFLVLSALAAIEDHASCGRVVGPEERHPREVGFGQTTRALHFDGEDTALAVRDEVDLGAGGGSPEEEFVSESEVVVERSNLLVDQRLQPCSLDLLGAVKRTGRTECATDANVEVVELGVRGRATSGPAAKDGDRRGEKQVFENREVSAYSFPLFRAFSCDFGDVQQ